MTEMTFADMLKWSREQGMTTRELDEGAITACLRCENYYRCGNLLAKDWCDVACFYAINSWKEVKGL